MLNLSTVISTKQTRLKTNNAGTLTLFLRFLTSILQLSKVHPLQRGHTSAMVPVCSTAFSGQWKKTASKFRITGPLQGKPTGDRMISLTKGQYLMRKVSPCYGVIMRNLTWFQDTFIITQITRFTWPTWSPSRPHVGPMNLAIRVPLSEWCSVEWCSRKSLPRGQSILQHQSDCLVPHWTGPVSEKV